MHLLRPQRIVDEVQEQVATGRLARAEQIGEKTPNLRRHHGRQHHGYALFRYASPATRVCGLGFTHTLRSQVKSEVRTRQETTRCTYMARAARNREFEHSC